MVLFYRVFPGAPVAVPRCPDPKLVQLHEEQSPRVLVLPALPCFTSSGAMESPTSKSAVIRLLMNLK